MELISKFQVYLSDLIKPDVINRCNDLFFQAFKNPKNKEPINYRDVNTKKKGGYNDFS